MSRVLLHVRGDVYLSLAYEDEVAIVAKVEGAGTPMVKPSQLGLRGWPDLEMGGGRRVNARELMHLIQSLLNLPEIKVTVEVPARTVNF